jgi:3-oxoacyl-[acyl-carrier-protein] synthase II
VIHGKVPPTINLHTQDPECDLNCTPNTPVKRDVAVAISNSAGFGGHNVCLAVRRFTA